MLCMHNIFLIINGLELIYNFLFLLAFRMLTKEFQFTDEDNTV